MRNYPEIYTKRANLFGFALCRRDWTRTSDPFVPNEVRYRAALHAVTELTVSKTTELFLICKTFFRLLKQKSKSFWICSCRRDWTRTSDPFVPNEVRYRAALHAVTELTVFKTTEIFLICKIYLKFFYLLGD